MFGLISKSRLRRELADKALMVYGSQDTLKKKYKSKSITEWAYYRKLWTSNGRLGALGDILDRLE